ncbi:hypothetical protein F383_15499 [Gossypium arboreum]|uniref:Uncharacterized protein n=1 Tax=Gossypium arboreum TaxID=29729 RepID=A0A0B0PTX7_GOSAR|nr:hypothetical protein F383_15499 [Gossypium arboreum]
MVLHVNLESRPVSQTQSYTISQIIVHILLDTYRAFQILAYY